MFGDLGGEAVCVGVMVPSGVSEDSGAVREVGCDCWIRCGVSVKGGRGDY
jgi:hypothetical protein